MIKSLNDAVYAYAAERNACPPAFSKLLIEVPGTKISDTQVNSDYFMYKLNAAANAPIPGTICPGVVAERLQGDVYRIWNPYSTVGNSRTLACMGDNVAAQNICKALGIQTTQTPY